MKTKKFKNAKDAHVYLIGSGIASLASAVYLEKDAGVPGKNIHILEKDLIAGGACDGAGDKEEGFVVRGGRMHEMHYECYWELLSHIPSLEDPNVSVRDESYDFNERFVSNGQARLLKDGKKMDQYYSSRFLTEKELKSDKQFMYNVYSGLKGQNKDGIVIRAEYKGRKLHVNMYKPIHTIIVGTTGSGKTVSYVNPSIQILSETKSKPSMVISDPKGELYDQHQAKLVKNGYDVKVVDLREPDRSSRWNPLDRAFDYWQRAHNLPKEILMHRGATPKQFPKLQTIKSVPYAEEWYEFNDIAYPDKATLKHGVTALQSKLKTKTINEVSDVALTLCPITGNDPMWSMGAQGFVKGILLAMLEDSLIPELGMTKDKFNFFNLAKIAGKRDVGQQDTLETLKNYFSGRDKLSAAASGGNNVVQNAPNTAKGFLGHVNSSLDMFNDAGVNYLTSATDIALDDIANKPTAIFIKIPDEDKTRHPLANIYISQLYKILIELANETRELALPRNVYFVLDEFGNLPKIEKIKSFVKGVL